MTRGLTPSLLIFGCCSVVLFALGGTGCVPAATTINANVGYQQTTPHPQSRRFKVARPLHVVIGRSVKDSFVIEPSPGMKQTYTQYRRTLGDALVETFEATFDAVDLAPAESGSGLELVIEGAEMQPTSTIRYHAVLLQDGKEVIDVAGVTEGRAIATGLSGCEAAMATLTREAVEKTAEGVYDGTLRSEKVSEDFWLGRTAAQ